MPYIKVNIGGMNECSESIYKISQRVGQIESEFANIGENLD